VRGRSARWCGGGRAGEDLDVAQWYAGVEGVGDRSGLMCHGTGARDGFTPQRQSESYEVLREWGLPVSDEFRVVPDLEGVEP